MAEENLSKKNKQNSSGIWMLSALICLVAAGVLSWLYSKESKAFNNCQIVNSQMEQEMHAMNEILGGYVENTTSDLKHNFLEMLNTYDKLIEKDSSKSDSLQAQKDSINVLLAQLTDMRDRSYYEINQLKRRNDRLREIMNRYIIVIDSLNTMNINLTSELDRTTSELSQTKGERDELRKQNEENVELLTKGAKLNAFNFKSVALRYQKIGSGTSEVNRAGRAEILSSTFTIGENTIARTGDKTIYMQIIDPNGQVLYKRPTDVVKIGGADVLYTGKRTINYQGQLLDMSIVFNLEGKTITSGNYQVKIFADGALIGKDMFTLK